MANLMKRLFRGAETPAEEMKEAKALKSGKISEKQYVAGERKEGHDGNAAKMARAIKSGKVSPKEYAKEEKAEGMKCGGKVKTKKMAMGGTAAPMSVIPRRGAPVAPVRPAAGGTPIARTPAPVGKTPVVNRTRTSPALAKKGGSVRGCGIATKGKTKGKMV